MSRMYNMSLTAANKKQANNILDFFEDKIFGYSDEDIEKLNMSDEELSEFLEDETSDLEIDFRDGLDIHKNKIICSMIPDLDYIESFYDGFSELFLFDIADKYPSYDISFNAAFDNTITDFSIHETFILSNNKYIYVSNKKFYDYSVNNYKNIILKVLGEYSDDEWTSVREAFDVPYDPCNYEEASTLDEDFIDEFYDSCEENVLDIPSYEDAILNDFDDDYYDDDEDDDDYEDEEKSHKYYDKNNEYLKSVVVGTKFDGRIANHETVSVGDKVILQRRPDNPYDSNAIEVLTTDKKSLGYIPAFLAEEIAYDIDNKIITITDSFITYSVPLSKRDEDALSPLMDIEFHYKANE